MGPPHPNEAGVEDGWPSPLPARESGLKAAWRGSGR